MFNRIICLWSVLAVLTHPQLSLGVGKTEHYGFPEERVIRDLVAGLGKRVPYYSKGFRIYPQLVVPCDSNVSRLGYIMLGPGTVGLGIRLFVPEMREDSLGSRPITVHDDTPTSVCTKYQPTSLRFPPSLPNQRSGVRVLDIERSVIVSANTLIGLGHTGGILLYEKKYPTKQSVPANITDAVCLPEDDYTHKENVPLIAVNAECRCKGCTSEFKTMAKLREIAEEERNVLYSFNEISVIPTLNFTQRGRISSWTFAARRILGMNAARRILGMNAANLPSIQIWRPNKPATGTGGVQFRLVASREIYLEDEADEDLVVSLDSDMNVEAGDVVGINQPHNSEVLLLFGEGDQVNFIGAPDSVVIDSSKFVTRRPLLTPEFLLSSERETTVLSTTVVVQSSRPQPEVSLSPSDPTRGGGGGSQMVVIIGSALGAAVLVLILMVTVVVGCLIWRRKRRKRESPHQSAHQSAQPSTVVGSNPVYEAPTNDSLSEPFYIEATHNSGLYESIRAAQMYEVPTTSLNVETNLDHRHTYHVLDASRSPQHGRNTQLPYHTPQQTPTSEESMEESGEGHDYHELEAPCDVKKHSLHDVADSELYVPCMEQRQSIYNTELTESTLTSSVKLYESLREVQSQTSDLDFFEESPSFWEPASTPDSLYQQLSCRKFREIPLHHIKIKELRGSGKFGTVKKGVWTKAGGEREVAVKMLHSDPTSEDMISFLQEAAIMGQFRHPNIVQLLGVVTLGEPLMIVLELLSNGDLSKYLKKNRALVVGESDKQKWPNTLLGFCQQVAAGLDYLSTKGFVHRDIAARNILLTSELTCKISDFGMSRDLQREDYYITRGGEIPVKWTAPETLNYKKYSTASDVWSFGCLMYEIWRVGHKPFETYTNMKAIELVESGYRLAPPPGCPRGVYHIMMRCWNPTARERPSSSELLQELTGQQESSLLQWKEEDSEGHPQASILGAGLQAGKLLYTELQKIYSQ